MTDASALAAIVVAAAALLIAAAQLAQQLLATAYVVRKCDRIVTGGLTKGGRREWHWRQFRFTVQYQAIAFALPQTVYEGLGISSTVQVTPDSEEIWYEARKTRSQRTSAQGCWVSLVQDLVTSDCLPSRNICVREESGDRIPEDLTVAPIRVDSITILLTCIAMGMQVFKYSPTTGEVTLSGGVGSISSSVHPSLGGLLHYSVFSAAPAIGWEAVRRHGFALRNSNSVWANAVFGRFKDKSYRPQIVPLAELMGRKLPILQQNGYPEDGNIDTIHGAACFMAFGHVDVCETVPPSVVRRWAAHFAEVIVKAHHVEVFRDQLDVESSGTEELQTVSGEDRDRLYADICSSPYTPRTSGGAILASTRSLSQQLVVEKPRASEVLRYGSFVGWVRNIAKTVPLRDLKEDEEWSRDVQDPSTYCPVTICWDLICSIDACVRELYDSFYLIEMNISIIALIKKCADSTVALSIASLHALGAPSWRHASDMIEKKWPKTFENAFERAWTEFATKHPLGEESDELHLRQRVQLYAELSILRSAYYTVMMRAAHPLGPGLTEESSIETSMVYMA